MLGQTIHRYIYLFGLGLIAISLVFSPFFLSLGQFIIAGNWIIELNFKEKLRSIKNKPSVLLFVGIYLIHVVWLFNTKNIDYALHDLKIKLPLLSLPIIIGTSAELTKNEFRSIIHLFLGSVLTSTFISTAIYLGVGNIDISDNRNLSIFISHIRFSLMLNMAIFLIIAIILKENQQKLFHIHLYLLVLVWLLIFLVLLGAFSGIVIFFLTLPIVSIYWIRHQDKSRFKRIGTLVILTTSILLFLYATLCIGRFFIRESVDTEALPTHTLNGHKYLNKEDNLSYENKYRVWVLISFPELEKEWNKKSDYPFEGKDDKEQRLKVTLVRYITSLGYTKDSVGFSMLTKEDIRMVEKGYTNHIYKNKWALYPRIYELLWELEQFFNNGNPSGHSLSLRFVFAKNGLDVLGRHLWLGTGTGDIDDEIHNQYELNSSKLSADWKFRPHNQYISFLATFGLIGTILLFYCLALGVLKIKENIDFSVTAFLSIALFSMLNEDTLETQAGATFFALFLSLLLLARKTENK